MAYTDCHVVSGLVSKSFPDGLCRWYCTELVRGRRYAICSASPVRIADPKRCSDPECDCEQFDPEFHTCRR